MNTNKSYPFTVRVYGILIHNNKLLISEEKWFDTRMIKLPGGGLEYGESPLACLEREFREECEISITKAKLLYIPEKYIPARFHENIQIVPLYYLVSSNDADKITTSKHFKKEDEMKNEELRLHWVELGNIDENFFSFPGEQQLCKFMKDNGIL